MKTLLSILMVFSIALAADSASAHGRGGISFSLGLPIFYGPVYRAPSYYYPYDYPRYYYTPPPVYYQEPLPSQQYSPPPEVRLQQAPDFIYSPELGFYVSVGVPYDIVYDGSSYYVFNGGYWYRGRYYNGPWDIVTVSNMPSMLLRHRIDQIRYHRDMEFRRYETGGEHYSGQFHRP